MAVQIDTELYCLIHLACDADWEALRSCCDDYITERNYVKLRDYLKNDAKSVFVEKKYTDKDYRDTFSNFYSKKLAAYPSTTHRMHFFTSFVQKDDLYRLETHSNDYIGYTVVEGTYRISNN